MDKWFLPICGLSFYWHSSQNKKNECLGWIGEGGLLFTVEGNVNWSSLYGKKYVYVSKSGDWASICQQFHSYEYILIVQTHQAEKESMLIVALFIAVKIWKKNTKKKKNLDKEVSYRGWRDRTAVWNLPCMLQF